MLNLRTTAGSAAVAGRSATAGPAVGVGIGTARYGDLSSKMIMRKDWQLTQKGLCDLCREPLPYQGRFYNSHRGKKDHLCLELAYHALDLYPYRAWEAASVLGSLSAHDRLLSDAVARCQLNYAALRRKGTAIGFSTQPRRRIGSQVEDRYVDDSSSATSSRTSWWGDARGSSSTCRSRRKSTTATDSSPTANKSFFSTFYEKRRLLSAATQEMPLGATSSGAVPRTTVGSLYAHHQHECKVRREDVWLLLRFLMERKFVSLEGASRTHVWHLEPGKLSSVVLSKFMSSAVLLAYPHGDAGQLTSLMQMGMAAYTFELLFDLCGFKTLLPLDNGDQPPPAARTVPTEQSDTYEDLDDEGDDLSAADAGGSRGDEEDADVQSSADTVDAIKAAAMMKSKKESSRSLLKDKRKRRGKSKEPSPEELEASKQLTAAQAAAAAAEPLSRKATIVRNLLAQLHWLMESEVEVGVGERGVRHPFLFAVPLDVRTAGRELCMALVRELLYLHLCEYSLRAEPVWRRCGDMFSADRVRSIQAKEALRDGGEMFAGAAALSLSGGKDSNGNNEVLAASHLWRSATPPPSINFGLQQLSKPSHYEAPADAEVVRLLRWRRFGKEARGSSGGGSGGSISLSLSGDGSVLGIESMKVPPPNGFGEGLISFYPNEVGVALEQQAQPQHKRSFRVVRPDSRKKQKKWRY